MNKCALILGLLISVNALAWREVGNGGGGILGPDGRYSTFFSANIPVKPDPIEASEIQGLDYLVNKISQLDIPEKQKSDILFQIYPSGDRAYYTVDESKLDAMVLDQLKEQYSKTMGVPKEHVVIYAMTDPKTLETFLMPAFFKLKPSEKAAILFHESLWINNPDSTYDQIVAAEQSAQAFFEHPEDNKAFYNFYSLLSRLTGTRSVLIYPIMKRELESGLPWAAKNPDRHPYNIYLKDIFGEKFMACSMKFRPNEYLTGDCSRAMLSDLIVKSQKYPNSIILKGLIDFIKRDGTIAIVTYADKNDSRQYQDYIDNTDFSINDFNDDLNVVRLFGRGSLYFDYNEKAQ
ncbi:MAG TPA: hypothetical protein VF412_00705 [Bdellovibrio sp.]|uniref:hypothetical protein n=1 Tax=Bdellovibrio sp. TaxID=28201 RepID=UPI002EFBEBB3